MSIVCGHVPPVLFRGNGEVERLGSTAPAVGMIKNWNCSVDEVDLKPGNLLVMFTDGVTEAKNPAVFCTHLIFCFAGLTLLGNALILSGWKQFGLLTSTLFGMLLTAILLRKGELRAQVKNTAGAQNQPAVEGVCESLRSACRESATTSSGLPEKAPQPQLSS